MEKIYVCGRSVVVDDDRPHLLERDLRVEGTVDGVPVELKYFVPWADHSGGQYTWYPASPIGIGLSSGAFYREYEDRPDFEGIEAWIEDADQQLSREFEARRPRNFIFHSRETTLPDGFHVRSGYVSFRLAGEMCHSSGWADFGDDSCLYAYRKAPDGHFQREELWESDFAGRDRDVLSEIVNLLYNDYYEVDPDPSPSGVQVPPELVEALGDLLDDGDGRFSIVTADHTAGREENTNGGAYVRRTQFLYTGEHRYYVREVWSCDGDLRPMPEWYRVNSGAFIRGFVEAVRQNAELEDYANPALAELATRLEREEMIL